MGQIACLCNEDLMDINRFGLDFEDALSLDCEWQFFGSPMQMMDAFSSGYNPQVVLVHLEHIQLVEIHRLIQGLRRSDPELCLLLLTEKGLQREDIMSWFDGGINGLIRIPFDPLLVSDPLVEVLRKKLGFRRAAPRVEIKNKISMEIASLEQAIVAETLNISCTGLFVRVSAPGVRVGEQVRFSLSLVSLVSSSVFVETNPIDQISAREKASKDISGTAEVVWVRPRPQGTLPEGIGLRFLDLSESGMDLIRAYIAKRRLSSMIPVGS